MDKNGKELLYALIKTHYLINNDYSNVVPYEGKINNKNDKLSTIELNLSKFPKNLRQMLKNFLTMNLEMEKTVILNK